MVTTTIRQRSSTSTEWATRNPILNVGEIAFETDTNLIKIGDGATAYNGLPYLSGSGGAGGINYIKNSSATINTNGWTTYSEGAALPTLGAGGTPSIVWSRSTTTPLREKADFNFVKSAGSCQGQGVRYDFTIDRADLAKVLTVSFDYEVLSGTYSDGDITVYLIEDPNGSAKVIQPAGYRVVNASVGTEMKHIATFQTSASVQSYRLVLHIASTSTAVYSLAFTNFSVGPQVVQYGAPVTDWQSYTPTITGCGTVVQQGSWWRRVGSDLEAHVGFSTGTIAASTFSVSLPAGLALDSTKLTGNSLSTNVGNFTRGAATNNKSGTLITRPDLSASVVYAGGLYGDVTNGAVPQNANAIMGSSEYQILEFKVPILGWSSTVQMSNDTDTRVVAAVVKGIAAVNAGSGLPFAFNTVESDSHGAFSTSTYKFKVPFSGFYRVTLSGLYSASAYDQILYKSGVVVAYVASGNNVRNTASTIVYANAGDELYFAPGTNVTLADISQIGTRCTFERLSGPSAIAATETVAARYTNTAGTAVTTGGAGAGLIPVPFSNRDYDSHGFFNGSTGVGTIPIAGKYRITCSLYFSAQAWTSVGKGICIRRNGAVAGFLTSYTPASPSTVDMGLNGSIELHFSAGDTFDIGLHHNEASSRTLSTLANINQIIMSRIGN